jgi:2-dehydropantoate 2-reductase
MPSFYLDLHSGRGKSEVEFLNGAIVRAGAQLGIPTPANRLLTETLMALVEKSEPLERYLQQPGRLAERYSDYSASPRV